MSDLVDNLWRAQISSCSCQVKTPEVKWHNTDCRYRVLSEASAEITRLRADLAAAQEERDNAIVQRAAERLAALTAEKALAAAQEREQRMREALDSIAAWDDHGANRALERDGTYGRFDEPGSVQIARAALGKPQ